MRAHGSDGPATVSLADVEMIEKRKKDRWMCVGTVHYKNVNDGPDAKTKTARCSNVCPSGMCIFIAKPIPPGSVIKISSIKRTRDMKAASVRWCEKLDGSLYREGIAYLK